MPQENCAYRWNTHCEERLSLPQAHEKDSQEEDVALHSAITNNRLCSLGMVSSFIYKLPRLLVARPLPLAPPTRNTGDVRSVILNSAQPF